jgi:hypothetical protein
VAFTPKALADGQLPAAQDVLFTGTADIATYVKSITLFNNNAANQVILIGVNRSGTVRNWRRFELLVNESADVVDDGEVMILEQGDTIVGSSTLANTVDFTISGVEEFTV